MENAVKALLIAAAVLIAVLIISLVMGVFNTGAEQVGNAGDLSEYEIQQFNDKFRKYEGKNKSASEVNALIKTAFYHNSSYIDDQSMRVRVGLNGGGQNNGADKPEGGTWLILREQFTDQNYPQRVKTVSAGHKYYVKAIYDSKTNLIYQIDVETLEYAKTKCTNSKHEH